MEPSQQSEVSLKPRLTIQIDKDDENIPFINPPIILDEIKTIPAIVVNKECFVGENEKKHIYDIFYASGNNYKEAIPAIAELIMFTYKTMPKKSYELLNNLCNPVFYNYSI